MKIKYPKLPKKFKEKWLKALRSGEYKQGEGHLYQDGCYCCLGIACLIAGMSTEKMGKHATINAEIDDVRVPKIIKNRYDQVNLVTTLFSMNDGLSRSRRSFKQIANWIEKNL